MGVCKGGAARCSSKMGGDVTVSVPQILPFRAGNVLNEICESGLSDNCAEVPQVLCAGLG